MSGKSDFNNSQMVNKIAQEDFEIALKRGFWRSVINWFKQDENKLLPFDEVRMQLPALSEHYIGLRQIPLENVVGSLGRYLDFDRAFLPRQTHSRGRWVSIDKAHLQDIILPPIEVYKVGDLYFVKDGNHRVSVARERGQLFLDADVIEIDVPVKLDPSISIDELIAKREQIEFFQKTHLHQHIPGVEIELSLPGGYQKLIEHIETHRWFMGEREKSAVDWDKAVVDWYQQVYEPLVKVIRDNQTLKDFSGRTEADLYLWIIEHLWYLREEYQGEISFENAAVDFVEKFSERSLPRILRLVGQAAAQIGGGPKEANGARADAESNE